MHRRILALDIHSLRVGYAVLEGPSRLVHRGTLRFRSANATSAAVFQAPRVIARWRPHRLVVTLPANQTLARERLHVMSHVFMDAARRARIPVSEMPRATYLNILCAPTRYAAALQVAGRFPELAPLLPRRRKIWQTEPPAMAAFDATAAGVAYLLRYQRTPAPTKTAA